MWRNDNASTFIFTKAVLHLLKGLQLRIVGGKKDLVVASEIKRITTYCGKYYYGETNQQYRFRPVKWRTKQRAIQYLSSFIHKNLFTLIINDNCTQTDNTSVTRHL